MPSLLRRSLALLRAPANELAFAVRNRVRWSRGTAALPHEAKDGLFDWLDPAERAHALATARRLEHAFDLAALRGRSTRLVFAENLALADRLLHLGGGLPVPAGPDGTVRAVDVGCGAFHYATALQRWLARAGPGPARLVQLCGVEIDGHRVYRDGHSRADHGRAHAALAGTGTRFVVGDFRRLPLPPQELVTLFYPFLSAFPLLQWGSPLSHLGPGRLLRRAVRTVRPGGLLVVANQTGAEFDRLRSLLAGTGARLLRTCSFATPLVPYADATAERIGSLWRCDSPLPAAGARR
ncbi:MAG: hypothetical protein FJ265_04985 [Planctomycetes bacterium]|nr:hypothetical protein [Planctomycetota bacterium]